MLKKNSKINSIDKNFCYLLQRLDSIENNFQRKFENQEKETRRIAELLATKTKEIDNSLDCRLEKIEQEIIGVQKAMVVFMWFAKIIGAISSIVVAIWKISQWIKPK